MEKFSPRPVELQQFILLGIILGLFFIIAWKLKFFLSAFLGAITLYVLLRGVQFNLTEKRRWKSSWSSLLLVSATFILLSGLLGVLVDIIVNKASGVDDTLYLKGAEFIKQSLSEISGYNFVPDDIIAKIAAFVLGLVPTLFNYTYSFAVNLFMMCFILYFMLLGGRKMEDYCWDLVPLSSKSLSLLKVETKKVMLSNIIGIPLLIIVQGITAIIGYLIFGAPQAIFWGVLTGLFTILPVIGTMIIWLPISISMIISGDTYPGLGLLIYGFLIISNVDNLFRFLLMKKMADVHPLITVFGVILGIDLLGIFGIIFGPLILSLFFLLIKIYNIEYSPERYPSIQPDPGKDLPGSESQDNSPIPEAIATASVGSETELPKEQIKSAPKEDPAV